MREIIVIGTLHCGMTPVAELADILAHQRPDQLLLEIKQSDIEKMI